MIYTLEVEWVVVVVIVEPVSADFVGVAYLPLVDGMILLAVLRGEIDI